MVHYSKCPLCSSDNLIRQFNCTDYFISKEVFPVYKCTSCGFNFTGDHPGDDDIARYYVSEDYISHTDTSKGLYNKIYRFVRNLMLVRKAAIVRKATGLNKGNILDIGSGTGHFAITMVKAGWNSKGIEINEKARNFAKAKFNLDVYRPEEILSLGKNVYDCITLWHVLEHFQDPFKYMSDIKSLLKQDGFCIIALPNIDSFDSGHYGKFWAALDVPRHFWHFNPDTFLTFINKTGFQLEKIKSLPFDGFYISILSEKYKKSGLYFLKGMIKGTCFWLLSLFNKKRSSSLIYIVKPPTP